MVKNIPIPKKNIENGLEDSGFFLEHYGPAVYFTKETPPSALQSQNV